MSILSFIYFFRVRELESILMTIVLCGMVASFIAFVNCYAQLEEGNNINKDKGAHPIKEPSPTTASSLAKKNLTYLLILLDRTPVEGSERFIGVILDELYDRNKPYRYYIDGTTKISLQIVDQQNFDDQQLLVAALFRTWGTDVTKAGILAYQKFSGRSGNGTTVEVWKA